MIIHHMFANIRAKGKTEVVQEWFPVELHIGQLYQGQFVSRVASVKGGFTPKEVWQHFNSTWSQKKRTENGQKHVKILNVLTDLRLLRTPLSICWSSLTEMASSCTVLKSKLQKSYIVNLQTPHYFPAKIVSTIYSRQNKSTTSLNMKHPWNIITINTNILSNSSFKNPTNRKQRIKLESLTLRGWERTHTEKTCGVKHLLWKPQFIFWRVIKRTRPCAGERELHDASWHGAEKNRNFFGGSC